MSNEHIALMPEADWTWLYPIYVPSYTRPGVAPLLNLLNDAHVGVQALVHIIVREEERAAYRAAYPWAKLVVVKLPGLGPARMRALRDADTRGYDRIVMLDDDIRQLSLLKKTTNGKGERYAQRYSPSQNGLDPATSLWRSLAVTCVITDGIFDGNDKVSYGAARNALFSGPVADPDIAGQVYRQSFPSCVMFFDLDRYKLRRLPGVFHFYGEDLAMFLANMDDGMQSFHMPCVAYDQSTVLETTIPLDPTDAVGRRVDMDNAKIHYPEMWPFLKESVRNKVGGVMRIGVNWPRWHKHTGNEPFNIMLADTI